MRAVVYLASLAAAAALAAAEDAGDGAPQAPLARSLVRDPETIMLDEGAHEGIPLRTPRRRVRGGARDLDALSESEERRETTGFQPLAPGTIISPNQIFSSYCSPKKAMNQAQCRVRAQHCANVGIHMGWVGPGCGGAVEAGMRRAPSAKFEGK